VVNTFSANPDELFNHGKNCYFADFLSGRRMYFPWDLDSTRSGSHDEIIPEGSPYADILMAVPEFYEHYIQIVNDLLTGPLSESRQLQFLDQLEPVLSEALEADPNSKMDGSVADHFEGLRTWVQGRFEDFEPLLDEVTDAALPPASRVLVENYPNPFNPSTEIRFNLSAAGSVELTIFDLSGRQMRSLYPGTVLDAGEHRVLWNGRSDEGQALSSGIYLASLATDEGRTTRKMILLK
jgi:hypothetical protein